jgi:S-adenosylmethionine:tRNA-ribosyltransferase-isomerase (queuine synthetase)
MPDTASRALTPDDFDFALPEELIALRPARPRRAARLLVAQGDAIADSTVADLGDWLRRGTCWSSTTRRSSRRG